MKHVKSMISGAALIALTTILSAQTADEIINKYVDAIGGKDLLEGITTVITEGTVDAMGGQGTFKSTLLNKKGFRQEVNLMGNNVIMCYTDTMGWQINPLINVYAAEYMPAQQFQSGRDQIFAAGPFFLDYNKLGYKAELEGQETVGMVNTYKIKLTTPQNAVFHYYFDPGTGLLVKLVQNSEMMGQPMDIILNLSNYQKPENGFLMPYLIDYNYGGQFFMTAKVNKAAVSLPVDPAVFAKP